LIILILKTRRSSGTTIGSILEIVFTHLQLQHVFLLQNHMGIFLLFRLAPVPLHQKFEENCANLLKFNTGYIFTNVAPESKTRLCGRHRVDYSTKIAIPLELFF